jgi:hypothetical protein
MLLRKKLFSHRILNWLTRLFISLLLIWVIFRQLNMQAWDWSNWMVHFKGQWQSKAPYLIIALLLVPVNYLLESYKWFLLVNYFEKHSFVNAIKGVLTGLTSGIVTPGRVGDYFGKLMFIKAENNWKAIGANFTAGVAQNLVTLILGSIGLILYSEKFLNVQHHNIVIGISLGLSALLLFLYYRLEILLQLSQYLPRFKWIKGIDKALNVMNDFSRKHLHFVLLVSLLRYLVFLGQYTLLILFWGFKMKLMIPASISVIYLLQSMLPFPPMMNFFVRSEIALLVFQVVNENTWLILSAAVSIWMINLLLPSLIGLLFLYRTNISKTLGYEK